MSDDQRPLCRCVKDRMPPSHCMCFNAQWFCSEYCQCFNCRNTEDNEDEVDELFMKKTKSDSFSPKMAGTFSFETSKMAGVQDAVQMHAPSSDAALGYEQRSHVKGCKCRKSGCNKRVCECLEGRVHLHSIKLNQGRLIPVA